VTTPPPQAAFTAQQLHPEWDGFKPLAGDEIYVSASTLMSSLAKPALEIWGRKEIGRKVLAEWDMLDGLRQTSMEMAQSWIEEAQWHAYRGQLSATDRGEAIHSCLEAWMDGLPTPNVPEELYGHLEHLAKAVSALNLRKIAAERVVYSRYEDGIGWAGRFDLVAQVSGIKGPVLLDLKTSGTDASPSGRKKRPYADSLVMQLGAYQKAPRMANHWPRTYGTKGQGRRYLLSDTELMAMTNPPEMHSCAVLYSTPKRCDIYPVRVHDGIEDEIRAAVRLYWYMQESSKGALGKRIYTTDGQ